MVGLQDFIRIKIRASGLSVYRVAQGSGVDSSSLYRFMKGESLGAESLGKLWKYLGLG